jgi:hypothetical protein
MRERTGPVSWLEAAPLAFPDPTRGVQWLAVRGREGPAPERAGPVLSPGL